MKYLKIVLIGSGNVGTRLGMALYQKGLNILQVYSRIPGHAGILAREVGAEAIHSIKNLAIHADLYIMAVSDDAIKNLVPEMQKVLPENALVVHTSGAVPATIFNGFFKRSGVFYPLQTLSLKRSTEWDQIPICIYAPNPEDLDMLKNLAETISRQVMEIDDEKRKSVHLAAVFANNFTNHILYLSDRILHSVGLSSHILAPLLEETVRNTKTMNAYTSQTGPARRGDIETIESHLSLIQKEPIVKDIYLLLSKSIWKTYHDSGFPSLAE